MPFIIAYYSAIITKLVIVLLLLVDHDALTRRRTSTTTTRRRKSSRNKMMVLVCDINVVRYRGTGIHYYSWFPYSVVFVSKRLGEKKDGGMVTGTTNKKGKKKPFLRTAFFVQVVHTRTTTTHQRHDRCH